MLWQVMFRLETDKSRANLEHIINLAEIKIISIYRNLTLTKDHRNISVNKSVDINVTL
jgi:hypothetical protein